MYTFINPTVGTFFAFDPSLVIKDQWAAVKQLGSSVPCSRALQHAAMGRAGIEPGTSWLLDDPNICLWVTNEMSFTSRLQLNTLFLLTGEVPLVSTTSLTQRGRRPPESRDSLFGRKWQPVPPLPAQRTLPSDIIAPPIKRLVKLR